MLLPKLTAESLLGFIDKDPSTREYDYDPSSRAYAMLQVFSGAGHGQLGVITDYNEHEMTVRWDTEDGTLGTALTTASDLEWVAPWLMEETDAVDEEINGFAQLAATKGQYGLILEEGLGKVLGVAAVAAGDQLVSSATDGTVHAHTAATILDSAARALFDVVTTDASVIYANVDAHPIGKVTRLTVPNKRGATRPGDFTSSL